MVFLHVFKIFHTFEGSCGLHILPNMATAALKGMNNFENTHNIVKLSIFGGNSAGNDLFNEVTM